MSPEYKVDFATFCHAGDAHRLHAPGQLCRQVESNNFRFNKVIVIHQYKETDTDGDKIQLWCSERDIDTYDVRDYYISNANFDSILSQFQIDLSKPQYTSTTDKAHHWKYHVVNHLAAIRQTTADYIVFADNDCWMVEQPPGKSWVERGIQILDGHPEIFIVSPNDGERQRLTSRFSQQMFLARVEEFCKADFNQPGWDGNVNVPGGPMPEYWAMLEGRMELYCRKSGQYRYVLGPEYRYYHHNKLTKDDLFETDVSKY